MTDSQQPRTTSSLQPVVAKLGCPSPHRRDAGSLLQKLQDLDLGTLRLVGMPYLVKYRWYIQTTCMVCPRKKAINADSMLRRQCKNCRCMTRRLVSQDGKHLLSDKRAQILSKRYAAIVQRTSNPACVVWPQYGARGIQNKFLGTQEFVEYCLKNLPHPTYKDMQIDRIDNNGNYEPGNLRLVPQIKNLRNTRRNQFYEYKGQMVICTDLWHLIKTDYPEFSLTNKRVAALAYAKVPLESILARKPRKRWAKPGSRYTTYSTPDPAIVSLYRGD